MESTSLLNLENFRIAVRAFVGRTGAIHSPATLREREEYCTNLGAVYGVSRSLANAIAIDSMPVISHPTSY